MVQTLTSALTYQQKKCGNMNFFCKFHIHWHAHLQIGNNGVMNMDININSILQWDLLHTSTHKSHIIPFLKYEITKLQHNNFVMYNLKTQDQITKLQLKKCYVQLENSRSFIMHIRASFVVCLNMLYAQVWPTVCHGAKQGDQWQREVGGTGPTIWYGCFKAEANYAHEGEDVEGDWTFFGNRWWCT